jgi:hypothetical protein
MTIKKQISDYRKEDIFLHKDSVVKTSFMPLVDFNGITIKASQGYCYKSGINKWIKKIKSGERPAVLIRDNYIIDGHHRVNAYHKVGIELIPVIIVK